MVDFSDKSDTACVYGSVSNNKSWLRIDIPDSLLAFVDRNGTTQFRISSINGANGELFFATGTDPNYQPQLDIKYKEFASIEVNPRESFNVFPNPTNGKLTINSKEILNGTVTIIDLTGRNYNMKIVNNLIETGNLANGRYMIGQINDKRTYIPFIKIN